MAIDEALLLSAEGNTDPPRTTFRIYKWSEPTLSIGFAQKPDEAADLESCRHHGIVLVKRPTGGRAVLHDKELTYSVVSNDASFFDLKSSLAIYKKISCVLTLALEDLGLPVSIAPSCLKYNATKPASNGNYLRQRFPCFTSATKHEVVCNGRKIIGSAQKRLRSAFLQHGSILLDCDVNLLASVTKMDPRYLTERLTWVNNETKEALTEQRIIGSLRGALEKKFDIQLMDFRLSQSQLQLAAQLKRTRYSLRYA